MKIIENKSSFEINQLINMARRENNKKRSFLIVNPSQAKHIPAKASQSLRLFAELGNELKKYISESDNILFIGFAETATAIGVGVAAKFNNSFYIHTTREVINNAEMIVEFKELHSHATQQTLQCTDWNNIIKNKNHIVFVEDEISTGTTIMNFVHALLDNNKVPKDMKFSVCSIINGMNEERKEELEKENVFFRYLLKISMAEHEDTLYSSPALSLENNVSDANIKKITINEGYMNTRTGVNTADYIDSVDKLAENIVRHTKEFNIANNDRIAVIGTEEFMYPAVYTAKKLENTYPQCTVVTHSTTRSPAETHDENDYPFKTRAALDSFYEHERKTFIYNTHYKYKLVILLTDSNIDNPYSQDTFIKAFTGCSDFLIVRWI